MTSFKAHDCPNCGTGRTGPYCTQCGQEQRAARVTLGAWIKGLFQEQLSLDATLVRTVSALVTRPGFLTLEWRKGRQARYTPPLRLYIIASLVFFGVTFFLGLPVVGLEVDFVGELSTVIAPHRVLAQNVVILQMKTFLTLGAALAVPLLALLMRAWPRQGFLYVDHLVFSLHFHSFVLLNLTVAYALLFWGLYGYVAAAVLAVGVAIYWVVAWWVCRPAAGRLLSLARLGFDTGAWGLLVIVYIFVEASLFGGMTTAPGNMVQVYRGDYMYTLARAAYLEGDTVKARFLGVEAIQLLGRVDADYRAQYHGFHWAQHHDFHWAQLHGYTNDLESAVRLAGELQAGSTSEELLNIGLAGSLAAQTGDTAAARGYYTRLLERVGSGEESTIHPATFASYVEGARAFLGEEEPRGP